MTAQRTWRDPAADRVGADEVAFLRALGGPAQILLSGRDRDPAPRRAAVTLLHGNEPSGVRAMHALLRSGRRPAGDLLLAIASVETALGPPRFTWRQRPGGRDLNRCFRPPFEGQEGSLAGELLRALEAFGPACLLDLHNNTGQSPPYGVAPRAESAHRALAGLFGRALVHSDLELGALVEATDRRWPSVTVECGRAGDPEADAVARSGLEAFASAAEPQAGEAAAVRVLREPRRVRLREPLQLAFATRPAEGADLTLREDLEQHNFLPMPAGTTLGWVRAGCEWPLEMRDAQGRDHSRELFVLEDGVLRAARDLLPIMVTTVPDVARSDCLFYVVRDPGVAAPRRLGMGRTTPASGGR